MNKLLTAAQAMERLGKQGAGGKVWICRELKSGRLKGEKVGSTWITTEKALEDYIAKGKQYADEGRRRRCFNQNSKHTRNSTKEQDRERLEKVEADGKA